MMLKPIDKIWGTTDPLIVTPMFELHRLQIKSWVRCSRHVHRFKHNAFYVLDGALFIDTANKRDEFDACQRLNAGDVYTVGPGFDHQFRTAYYPCTALEMYYTEPLSEDIIRRNVGCVIDPDSWKGRRDA